MNTYRPHRVLLSIAAVVVAAFLLTIAASAPLRAAHVPVYPAPPSGYVSAYATDAGLQILPKEGTVLHIHSHLSIAVDGTEVVVPANVGIDTEQKLYSEIHTHDTSGILHVESARNATFTLQQFLTEWAVPAGPHAFGPYIQGQNNAQLAVFVNGKERAAGLDKLTLANHEDIDIVITTDGSKPVAPAAFVWPKGY